MLDEQQGGSNTKLSYRIKGFQPPTKNIILNMKDFGIQKKKLMTKIKSLFRALTHIFFILDL